MKEGRSVFGPLDRRRHYREIDGRGAGETPLQAARGSAVKRSVRISLGEFASKVLAVGGSSDSSVPGSVEQAIRCYLNDKVSRGPGWSYPAFLRGRGPHDGVELQLSVDDSLWRSLEEEAEDQDVSAEQMLEHAIIYFAAEVDAGRMTERILDDLDRG